MSSSPPPATSETAAEITTTTSSTTTAATCNPSMANVSDEFIKPACINVRRPGSPRPLNAGVWSPEEEEYAACLVEEFQAGQLAIPNGTSLRKFLARMLHCRPKRISKKFEGQDYTHGKRSYEKSTEKLPPGELQRRQTRLTELERQYKDALLEKATYAAAAAATAGSNAAKRKRPKENSVDNQTQKNSASSNAQTGGSGRMGNFGSEHLNLSTDLGPVDIVATGNINEQQRQMRAIPNQIHPFAAAPLRGSTSTVRVDPSTSIQAKAQARLRAQIQIQRLQQAQAHSMSGLWNHPRLLNFTGEPLLFDAAAAAAAQLRLNCFAAPLNAHGYSGHYSVDAAAALEGTNGFGFGSGLVGRVPGTQDIPLGLPNTQALLRNRLAATTLQPPHAHFRNPQFPPPISQNRQELAGTSTVTSTNIANNNSIHSNNSDASSMPNMNDSIPDITAIEKKRENINQATNGLECNTGNPVNDNSVAESTADTTNPPLRERGSLAPAPPNKRSRKAHS